MDTHRRRRIFVVLLAATTATLALAACAAMAPAAGTAGESPPWRLQGQAMISAADPRAVEAGLNALRQGGSAVDAAIAVHAVLGLVEPQSSGLGGGGYMVVHDRSRGSTTSFDGREAAPAAATPDYFTVNGQNLGFGQAVQSGRSVGVPSAIALYKADMRGMASCHGRAISRSPSAWRKKASSSARAWPMRWVRGSRMARWAAMRGPANISSRTARRWRLVTGAPIPPTPRRCAASRRKDRRHSIPEVSHRTSSPPCVQER
jgi:hypothetical protein